MNARRRSPFSLNLPDNLYTKKSHGRIYYTYRNPNNGKSKSLGSDKDAAIRVAIDLNDLLVKPQNVFDELVKEKGRDIAALAGRYERETLKDRNLTNSTHKQVTARLRRISNDIGSILLEDLTVETCATYLNDNFTKDSYVKHRGELVRILNYAMNIGWINTNPAEATYSKTAIKKERQRMTIDQFKAIYEIAPDGIKVAMLLALTLLQGRNEVINAKLADYKDGWLYIIRKKTERFEHSHIKVSHPLLPSIIKMSRASGVASPYIVHSRPARRHQGRKGCDHWTQYAPNNFTKLFREIADSTGVFDHLTRAQRPTFHEIRALGSWVLEQQGADTESVQSLLAHSDEKMTKHYQSGHATKWVEAESVMDLSALGISI